MAKRKTNEQFIKEVYELVGDEYEFLQEYINTHTKIKCRHNKCGYEWKVRPNDFLNNGSRCPECRKIERASKQRKTHEEFINELEDIHPNKYEVLGKYKRYHDKIKVKCKDCGYISERSASNLLRNGCPNCSGIRPITQEEFESDIKELWDGVYKVVGEYINSDTPVETLCKNCNKTWFARPYNLKTGYGCPNCAGNAQKTTEDFKNDIYSIVGNEYDVLGEYINNKVDILIRHNECGYEWMIRPSSFLSDGVRCPLCTNSRGENAITNLLDNKNIKYIREYRFDDCRNERPLPFDFYLPDYNLLIEYDGEQHFMPKTYGGISDEQARWNLKEQQKRDNIKTQYCKDKGIELLRIPYWEFSNIEKIVCEKLNMLIPSQAS